MNQKFLGNYITYASEILYACINPIVFLYITTKSISKLLHAIKKVLNNAIKLGGSSIKLLWGYK